MTDTKLLRAHGESTHLHPALQPAAVAHLHRPPPRVRTPPGRLFQRGVLAHSRSRQTLLPERAQAAAAARRHHSPPSQRPELGPGYWGRLHFTTVGKALRLHFPAETFIRDEGKVRRKGLHVPECSSALAAVHSGTRSPGERAASSRRATRAACGRLGEAGEGAGGGRRRGSRGAATPRSREWRTMTVLSAESLSGPLSRRLP